MSLLAMALIGTAGLFIGMLLGCEAGRALGARALRQDPDGFTKGIAAAEGAVFGLLGLMIALTLSGAAQRFHDRSTLIVEEANAIGTAYLRIDLLPADAQPPLRDLVKRYLDKRLETYAAAGDTEAVARGLREGEALQGEIWRLSVAGCKRPDAMPQATIVLIPAMNEMIDIASTRTMATRIHPPMVIYLIMGALGLVGSVLVGYATAANRKRNLFHTVMFAAITSLAIYVIVDLEFPRLGLIRVDSADQMLVDMRQGLD